MNTTDGGLTPTHPTFLIAHKVNLRGMFTELGKAVSKWVGGGTMISMGIAADAPAAIAGGINVIVGSFPDLVAALGNIESLSNEEKAYLLVRRALAAAVAELTDEVKYRLPQARDAAEDFEWAMETLDEDLEWKLAPDFLQRPREIELLPPAQKALESFLVEGGMPEAQARSTAERLPTYFGLALHEELTKSDHYDSLVKELSSPTAEFRREAWAWDRYRAKLIREPDRQVFDASFGLRAVFVPLRAYWVESFKEAREEKKRTHPDTLENYLDGWFARSGDGGDTLRVISGDPGSGKSSCAKMWAAKVAEANPGWRVVYIALHQFDIKGDLRSSLRIYLQDWERIAGDLLEPQCADNTLLCFDGLDELAMEGKSAREAAVAFVTEVRRTLESLYNVSPKRRTVLALIGGRKFVVQDCGTVLRVEKQVLHLYSYLDRTSEPVIDQRSEWWKKYGLASGIGHEGIPRELIRTDLDEITEQPLLNYLLALSYDREDRENRIDFTARFTVNRIYEDILDQVYQRRWGDGRNMHAGQIKKDEFIQLLEEVGVAVWHDSSRSATRAAIQARAEQAELVDILKSLENDSGSGIFRLLTAFYFRHGQGEGTVEFTHKSFGEYLTARRIVRQMRNTDEERRRRKLTRRSGWTEEYALEEWARLCGPQPLDATDSNLSTLLQNEVLSCPERERNSWWETFEELANNVFRFEFPMEKCGLSNFQEMDQQSRNAEEALLASMFHLAPTEPKSEDQHGLISVFRINRLHLRRGLMVWQLGYCVVSSLNRLGCRLWFCDLFGANLEGADLQGADLQHTSLKGTNLKGANLQGANLGGASLQNANLRGTNLQEANLQGANLQGANLQGADMRKSQGWKEAISLEIRQVEPKYRPDGWEDYFREQGWPVDK